jgi:HPt (histidine-containing phosphotransfer) domain-containing protein
MKKILSKIIGSSVIASLLVVPMLSVRAEVEIEGNKVPPPPRIGKIVKATSTGDRIENRGVRIENRIERPLLRASTTEKRLENRENNIERIRARVASTTASTSVKRLENLDKRLEKQREQMTKVRERLLEKELKVTDALGKIASKIQERITILTSKGLDMTAAKAKLAEASAKIEAITVEGDNLATLINTEITESNKDTLFVSVKASQNKIRTFAREAHGLLVDTVKEITKVLPKNDRATTTATSTNN